MSSIFALLCVGWFALTAAWSVHAPAPYALDNAELYFQLFIQKYQKNYANEHEKQARFQIFKENLEEINSLNERSTLTVFGITQFSDISNEEFKSKYGRFRNYFDFDSGCTYVHDSDINYNDAPESWDWREHQAVTPVKDQSQCGSCYAFSAIGNIEGQYAIKHGDLVSLSEQQIVDCDPANHNCCGGYPSLVMRVLIQEGGSMLEASYPYNGEQNNVCRFDANKVKVQLSDCRSFNLTSQEKLKQLLYHNGPISIAIKDEYVQRHHGGGIIEDQFCDEGEINHAVLLVGYGAENGVPYWIVKNSWGEHVGEHGYFRMQRGEGFHSCGMFNQFMASAIVV